MHARSSKTIRRALSLTLTCLSLGLALCAPPVIFARDKDQAKKEPLSASVEIKKDIVTEPVQSTIDDFEKRLTDVEKLFQSAPFWPGQDGFMDRFFTRFPDSLAAVSSQVTREENDREIKIEATVPGIEAADLDVRISPRFLTIKGTHKESSGKSSSTLKRRLNSFSETIGLSSRVDPDGSKATLKNGVLTVIMPKLKVAQEEPRKLEVTKEI